MASSHKLVHDALEANKIHQAALIKYAQDLATEIQELDSFLVRYRYVALLALPTDYGFQDNIDGLENDGTQGFTVHVRGASKPHAVLQSSTLLKPGSTID